MSGAVTAAKKVAIKGTSAVLDPMGLTSAITGMDVESELSGLADLSDDTTATTTETTDVNDQLQDDATNAARAAEAAKKKKKTASSVLTSPLGASTAKTAVTKLGGM